jgi:hypothetical protein
MSDLVAESGALAVNRGALPVEPAQQDFPLACLRGRETSINRHNPKSSPEWDGIHPVIGMSAVSGMSGWPPGAAISLGQFSCASATAHQQQRICREGLAVGEGAVIDLPLHFMPGKPGRPHVLLLRFSLRGRLGEVSC